MAFRPTRKLDRTSALVIDAAPFARDGAEQAQFSYDEHSDLGRTCV